MGIISKHHTGVGIELAESSGRAVALEESRGRLRVSHALCLNRRQEGFLDAREMRQAVAEWLTEQHLDTCPAAGNLSPAATVGAVYEFPAEVPRKRLRELVAFQTRNLCGITDEPFIYGVQRLSANQGARHRILIAACQEHLVNDAFESHAETGADLWILAETGQALANAFAHLQPDDFRKDSLQVLLLLDQDAITCLLFKGGEVLYLTSLDILEECLPAPDKMPQQRGRHDASAPYHHLLQSIIRELKGALQQWRQSRICPAEAHSLLSKVWLTGDCVLERGFAEELSVQLACEVMRFGVPARLLTGAGICCPGNLDVHPYLTVAYGLALQAMGRSMLKISLLPHVQQQRLRHLRDFPYLCGAVACVITMLTILLASWSLALNRDLEQLNRRKEALLQCKKIIPAIEQSHAELNLRYQRLQPLLEYGRRSHLFAQALLNCQQALPTPPPKATTVRIIYLADAFSFDQLHGRIPSIQPLPKSLGTPQQDTLDTALRMTSAETATTTEGEPRTAQRLCPVQAVPRLTTLYLGGIIEQNEARFETLKKLQENFSQKHLFANVDDYTDCFREMTPGDPPDSWNQFLQNHQSRLAAHYSLFLLQLPFLEKATP